MIYIVSTYYILFPSFPDMPKNQPQAPLDHLNCLSTKLATCLWLYPVVPQPSDELPVQ